MKSVSRPNENPPRRRLPIAIQLHDPVWWRWTAIATLLAADLGGVAGARETALAVALYQAVKGLAGDTTPKHFRAQVQFVYVGVMALSFVPALGFLAWIQMLGTVLLVVTGYCPLARAMVLFPGNRRVGLSWDLVRRVVYFPVTRGFIIEELEPCRPRST